MVNRREMGLLKTTPAQPAARPGSLLAAIVRQHHDHRRRPGGGPAGRGTLGFGVHCPANVGAFLLAVVVGMVSFSAMGLGMSTLVPNQDAAGPDRQHRLLRPALPVRSVVPAQAGLRPGQVLSWYFPVHHMITAVFAPFNLQKGASPWAWHDLLVIAIWGVVGAIVAVRRWEWSPRRSSK